MERTDYGEGSSWNGQIMVRVVHGTDRLSSPSHCGQDGSVAQIRNVLEDNSWNGGTSAYGHPTSTVTSQLRSLWLSPKQFPIIPYSPTNTITTLFRYTCLYIATNPVPNGRITPIKSQSWSSSHSQTDWMAALSQQ